MRCVAAEALVIGYGNDLRRDDGAGRLVADAVGARRLPDVAVCSVMQLTPELALEMAGCDVVVFVDASIAHETVTVQRVDIPDAPPGPVTHHANPATLASLVPAVGSPPRDVYLVSVPAIDLGLGLDITDETEAAVAEAVEVVTGLVSSPFLRI